MVKALALLGVVFLCGSFSSARIEKKDLSLRSAIPFKELTFFLQPYDAAGVRCEYEALEASHDYLVNCGSNQFAVHFFARPHRHPKQDSLEVLLMISETSHSRSGSGTSTVSLWLKNSKGSESQNVLVSLGVLNDTASLDVRVALN